MTDQPVVTAARYRIGEVAERAGVTTRTLRYYEECGLLNPAGHSPGGGRRYSEADAARLLRIIELRDVMGFNLEQIGEILRSEDRLADLKAEAQRGISEARRHEILLEAIAINDRMRGLARDKAAALRQFQAELEEKAELYRRRAEELNLLAGSGT